MSSGLCGFFAHAGTIKALVENGLEPAAVSGSSAGALAGGVWAAGIEPHVMAEELAGLEREDFWDPSFGRGLLRGERFAQKLRSLLPVAEFEACRVALAISVFDMRKRQNEVLSRGGLAEAIQASCALPGLFQPVMIDGRPKLDGGIKDWPGFADTPQDERTLNARLTSRLSKHIPGSSHSKPVTRPNTQALEIADVPLVTPFTLRRGMEAYRIAEEGTLQALDQPVRA